MAKNLFIVESPAKAKTIEGFLGKEYTVKSSIGHIRDLIQKKMGIDIANNFEPQYEISPEKKGVVAELKKLAKSADTVWLATDEDREGEAIAWHLYEALDLNDKKTKRVVYSEITKPAILKAIDNPRKIDQHLVDAQQARRVLDRLVGYELSPILWKKVKPSLSAGRVQSVAVRLIVEREREIMNFKSVSTYKVSAVFETEGKALIKAELSKKLATLDEAKAFLEKCKTADFSISNLETKPAKKSPSAPFTTSTLQQEAGRKFGYSVAHTMSIAQRLYEAGKITYMRTDSVNLSDAALDAAQNEIKRIYGDKYHQLRKYKTKSKGAQEAHEAIRPTYMNQPTVDGEVQEMRLYDLIWKRTLASQMADAELEKTTVTITVSTASEIFIAQGEVLKFDGFLKVYMETKENDGDEDEATEGILPPMKIGEKLISQNITATERFSHHPPRYTEASLVKKLEELGIGRPSTYAPTISTVQKRGYVVKEDRVGTSRNYNVLTLKGTELKQEVQSENTGAEKSKLFPSDIGMVVTDFLIANFKEILDYNFTAHVEEEFDEIAEGKLTWTKMLDQFYKPFHKTVEAAEGSERASGEKILGKDPKTGRTVLVRIGRFGPMVQLGEQHDEEKPRYASMRKDQRIDNITLEDALTLFKLPRIVGKFENDDITVAIGRFGPYIKNNGAFVSIPREDDPYTISLERCEEILRLPKMPKVLGTHNGQEISVNKGRFGPYIKYGNTFASLSKGEDPFSVTLPRAIELIDAKLLKDAEKNIKLFPENADVKVVNGRYGPCIQIGRKFFKIPKGKAPVDLTLQECLEVAGVTSSDEITKAKFGKFTKGKTPEAKKEKPAKKTPAKKTVSPVTPAKAKKAVKKTIAKKSKSRVKI
ncbi:MAG: type I DNA topoisomerase [Bacteroidetes bacterium]|nr:type I DNA topoisomerase [Bacteroidota bacterium]